MEINEGEWTLVKKNVERLVYTIEGNGKPGLYDRLKSYIDERDEHKERNHQQDMQDLKGEVDEKHKENRAWQEKMFDKQAELAKLCYIGLGIVITLEALGLFKK